MLEMCSMNSNIFLNHKLKGKKIRVQMCIKD